MKGLAVALLVAVSAAAFAAPKKIGGIQNETGDVTITCIGDYIFAEPMVVVLQPSKITVPDTNAVYAVECRIIYRDKVNPPPSTKQGLARYGLVCDFLNDCLQGFVREEYSDWDFFDLLEEYRSGNFAVSLSGRSLADYISKCVERYKIKNPDFKFEVDINAVQVQSIADFAAALKQGEDEDPEEDSMSGAFDDSFASESVSIDSFASAPSSI